MPSEKTLKLSLRQAAALKNKAERAVNVAAIVAEALRAIGQDPVLVGGAAVEFYTQGEYSTADIDMVAVGGPKLEQVMRELGFVKLGKDFVNRELELYIEFPGESLGPSEHADQVIIGTRKLRIISIEDLIIDRLCSFKFWQSAVDGMNAMILLELGQADEKGVEIRAREEDVADALQIAREITESAIRKKLTRSEASKLLNRRMRALKA